MQIVMKIKKRCLFCKKEIKKNEVIIIRKNKTIIHRECALEIKRRLKDNA